MQSMIPIAIKEKFESYPPAAKTRLYEIRQLIFEVADELELGEVSESLKWGEASYSCKIGSPIRIDWKAKHPDQVSLFVNCRTILVDTFKVVYGDAFDFVGNRELVITLSEPLPVPQLKGCIAMALQYHRLKKLPLLGA